MDRFFGLAFDLRALRLLDVVLPRRCAACGLGEELVCADCRGRLRRLDGTLCARCGERFASRMHIDDLKQVLPQLGFEYGKWQNLCPACKRKSLAGTQLRMQEERRG